MFELSINNINKYICQKNIFIYSIYMSKKTSIDKYKIIKELGNGMVGTTWLVTLNKKKYALKIEKISEENLEFNTKYPEWREIDFSEKFGNNYPEQFVKLIQYNY